MKFLKLVVAALIAVFATTSLTACATMTYDPSAYAAIIDVRTPEEWAEGHLVGAVRMGIADADFASQLATLDPAQDYYIYCRSGNRAGQAIDYMRSIGFTGELINGGAVANAATELSLEVVQGE